MGKLASRKLWMCVAAFLASIGASLTGYFSDNQDLMTVGVVCTMSSAAIYAGVEAYVDGKSAAANMVSVVHTYNEETTMAQTRNISASTNAKDVVVSAINQDSGAIPDAA